MTRRLALPELSTVVGSAAGMLGVRLVNLCLGLALAILLARTLGLDGYGTYAFAFALAGLLGLPSQFGVPVLVLRETAKARSTRDHGRMVAIASWGTAIVVGAGACVLAGATVAASVGVTIAADAPLLLLLSAGLALAMSLIAVGSAILNGLTRPFLAAIPDGVLRPALLIALVFATTAVATPDAQDIMALHVVAAATALIASGALCAGALCAAYRQSEPAQRKWTGRAWLASVIPFTANSALSVLNNRLDILMVGILVGPAEVALYAVANQIAGLGLIGQTLVNAQAGPRLAAAVGRGDLTRAQTILNVGTLLAGGFGIAVVVGVAVLGGWLLRIGFGAEFAPAYGVLLVLALAQAINSLMGATALTLNMAGLERLTLRATILSLAINAVLNVSFVLAFGAVGAACATMIAMTVTQATMLRLVKLRLGLDTHMVAAVRTAVATRLWRV